MYCPFCYHAYRSNNVKPGFCVYCGERLDGVELLESLKEVQLEHAFNDTNEIFSSRNKEKKEDEGIIYSFSVGTQQERSAETEKPAEVERPPMVDIAPEAEETSDAEEVSSVEDVSEVKDVSEIEETLLAEEASEEEETPVLEEAHTVEQISAVEETHIAEESPLVDENPSVEQDFEVEEAPETVDKPADDAALEADKVSETEKAPEVETALEVEKTPEAERVSEAEDVSEVSETALAEETSKTEDIKEDKLSDDNAAAAAVAVAEAQKTAEEGEEKPVRETKVKTEKPPKEKPQKPKKIKAEEPINMDNINKDKIPAEKKSGKGIIAVIIAIVLILVAAGIFAYFFFFGGSGNNKPVNPVLTTVPIETTATADETEPKSVYENISGESIYMTSQQSADVHSGLEQKSTELGFAVKLMFTEEKSDIQKIAADSIKKECGKDGILLVINEKTKQGAVAACGKGETYLPKEAKEAAEKAIGNSLESNDTYNACVNAITAIPNNKSEISLYSNYKRVDGADQVVYADSSKGELVLIDWSNIKPQKLFTAEKVYFGMAGVTDKPSENKAATPKGTFELGFAFSDEKLETRLDTKLIEPGMVWVDDSSSDYYNTLQSGTIYNSKWNSSEDISGIFSRNEYYACILIEHNGDGISKGESGKGSAIFLTGRDSLGKSYGDVVISSKDMKTLLSLLEEGKNPNIVIK